MQKLSTGALCRFDSGTPQFVRSCSQLPAKQLFSILSNPPKEQRLESGNFSVRRFGAQSTGTGNETRSFQQAIDTCNNSGGGTVIVPTGTYRIGAIRLCSNLNLHLAPGAKLIGSDNQDDYHDPAGPSLAPLIGGDQVENVSITGFGTIDGNGAPWQKKFRIWHHKHNGRGDALGIKEDRPARPRCVRFLNCRNVTMQGITIQNTPAWAAHLNACEDVVIDGVRVYNPQDWLNSDGINPDGCKNVHFTNCHFSVGDDCIGLKAGTPLRKTPPCENITITNCTFATGHGAIVFGNEISAGFRNVVVSNCIFDGTYRGIRIKSKRGYGGGVQHAVFSNIVMRDVAYPIVLDSFNYDFDKDSIPESADESTPRHRNLHYSNIQAYGAKKAAHFVGLPERNASNILMQNVTIAARTGMICRDIDGLICRQVNIAAESGPPLECERCVNIDTEESLPVAEGIVDTYSGQYMDT
ncbi:MAG: hypothetical protein GF398_18110 [Chitinivibrionales bacterium]|nr:hypothetical protein [Chitinivibrionales bacterium]